MFSKKTAPQDTVPDQIDSAGSQSEGEVIDTGFKEVKTNDAVFGEITEGGPNYRAVSIDSH